MSSDGEALGEQDRFNGRKDEQKILLLERGHRGSEFEITGPCPKCKMRATIMFPDNNTFVCRECLAYGMKTAASSEDVEFMETGYTTFCYINDDDWERYLHVALQNIKQGLVQHAVDIILSRRRFASVDNKEIYCYDDGIYVKDGICIIEKEAQMLLQERGNNRSISEIIGHIRRRSYRNLIAEYETSKNLVCLQNVVWNSETYEICEHSPDYFFLNKMPVVYEPEKKCPAIEKFFAEVLDEKDQPLIQELFGFILSRGYAFHFLFVFTGIKKGSGRNGKGTLLRLIRRFLGDDACAAISLHDLTKNRFMASNLFGKKANLCGDMSSRDLEDDSLLKKLTGQDAITLDRKHKDPITFTSEAKVIGACNELFNVKDDSIGWWGRLIIVEFPHCFLGREDRDLDKKLQTEEEISGLFNFALEGLKRLRSQNQFSYNLSIEDVRFRWKSDSEPVAAFLYECVTKDVEAVTPKDALYQAYRMYCLENEITPQVESGFHKKLRKYYSEYARFGEASPTMDYKGKREQVRCFTGVKLKEDVMQRMHENKGDNPFSP